MLEGDHADTSWYSEGTAEFYSLLLAYRAKLYSADEFVTDLNKKMAEYYKNPLQFLSNHEAEQIYWKDARAGHVPYGRGFAYLAKVDAEIRAKSGGKRSLDDIVVPLSDRSRNGEAVGVEDWLNAVSAELGDTARRDFAEVMAGKIIVPAPNSFGPCFKSAAVNEIQQDIGFDVLAYMGKPRTIKGLMADSAAAIAGLMDGDQVLEGIDVADPSFRYDQPITIKVRRDGKDLLFTFAPRGKTVTSYQWSRDKAVPDSQCKL
jgi:predicted metalloprotease with PDZ domain